MGKRNKEPPAIKPQAARLPASRRCRSCRWRRSRHCWRLASCSSHSGSCSCWWRRCSANRAKLKLGDEMDLAGDFEEAERGIQVIADSVLGEGFDFGVGQAGGSEVIEGVLEQLAT